MDSYIFAGKQLDLIGANLTIFFVTSVLRTDVIINF
jgi:hypothetical protein